MADFFVKFEQFFDRTAVIDAMDKKTNRVMGRVGAFARRTMQQLMRKRKKISSPGSPPHSHSPRYLLREKTFFGYDRINKSLVVGPQKLDIKNRLTSSVTVPQLLNEGGAYELEVIRGTNAQTFRGVMEARPFTEPTKNATELKFINAFGE
jgi:hypothetical protein